ncbi:MAG: hypothetical protein BroJett014_14910 [Planctomycetota bacterium]|nr:MAG: hypothetical protein BroJett014_14910 [Planctomycetota bacterium]
MSGSESRIALIDKDGKASPALNNKGEPGQIQGTVGCQAGAQGFVVFGDPAQVAWYCPAK